MLLLVGVALAAQQEVAIHEDKWFHCLEMVANVSYFVNLSRHDMVVVDAIERSYTYRLKVDEIYYDRVAPQSRSMWISGDSVVLEVAWAKEMFLRFWLIPKGLCGDSVMEFATWRYLTVRSRGWNKPHNVCLFALPGFRYAKVKMRVASRSHEVALQMYKTNHTEMPILTCPVGMTCRGTSGWAFFLRVSVADMAPYALTLNYEERGAPPHHRGCWVSPIPTFDHGDVLMWPPIVGKPGTFRCDAPGHKRLFGKIWPALAGAAAVVWYLKPEWVKGPLRTDMFAGRFEALKEKQREDACEDGRPTDEVFPETSA